MNELTLTTQYDTGTTAVSNIFIDNYMPSANGEYVKIYMYLLKCAGLGKGSLSIDGIADAFNQTESDIVRALKYWDKAGVITYVHSSLPDGGNHASIQLNNLCSSTTESVVSEPAESVTIKDAYNLDSQTSNVMTFPGSDSTFAISEKPLYQKDFIKELSNQEDFSELLFAISSYFGRELSSREINTVIYFFDKLNFSTELIDFLFQYCDHKGMAYAEKVAVEWAKSGVKSIADAKSQILLHRDSTYSVIKAFGIKGRTLGVNEANFIKTWFDTYNFSTDMVIEACNRTMRAIHEPSFEYAGKILTEWHKNNITTIGDVNRSDAEYELQNKQKKSNTSKNNKFNQFNQSTGSLDELEKSLLKM